MDDQLFKYFYSIEEGLMDINNVVNKMDVVFAEHNGEANG